MLRFIKHSLTTIDGVSIFPIISLLMFSLFFTGVAIMVFRMKKEEINELENLPFAEKDNLTNSSNLSL
jgi:cbb3-type cytochrome oxidase subunit 3